MENKIINEILKMMAKKEIATVDTLSARLLRVFENL